ncbi:MAG: hypothetical protein QXP36_09935 [Conexivisphaerales archaeon]
MIWIRSKEELEKILEKFPYEKQLWNSRNPWDKLEALYFLELMGYAFAPKLKRAFGLVGRFCYRKNG